MPEIVPAPAPVPSTVASLSTTPEQQAFDEWSAGVSAKQFIWFISKASTGIAAAPLVLTWLGDLGLTLTPGSFLAKTVPTALPAILGGLLHAGQDWAALKTNSKWL
jgi:hypothetical protein